MNACTCSLVMVMVMVTMVVVYSVCAGNLLSKTTQLALSIQWQAPAFAV